MTSHHSYQIPDERLAQIESTCRAYSISTRDIWFELTIAIQELRMLRGKGMPKEIYSLCEKVCTRRSLPTGDIIGGPGYRRTRTRRHAQARWEIWWTLRRGPWPEELRPTLLQIAKWFNCDHSTVMHGVREYEKELPLRAKLQVLTL